MLSVIVDRGEDGMSPAVLIRDSEYGAYAVTILTDPTVKRIITKPVDTFTTDGEAAYVALQSFWPSGNLPDWSTISNARQNAYSNMAQSIGQNWQANH